jgi:hypothetical protein
MWRAQTPLADFPFGWSLPQLAYRGDVFEASHIYRMPGAESYLCLIEAQLPDDRREYRVLTSRRLSGPWVIPEEHGFVFASAANLTQPSGHWTDSVSHGELLRDGFDERMIADPASGMLFQGVLHQNRVGKAYGEIVWRIGLMKPERP